MRRSTRHVDIDPLNSESALFSTQAQSGDINFLIRDAREFALLDAFGKLNARAAERTLAIEHEHRVR
ncbi:MAG: hypothetical protein RL352_889 [Actinomycetota bacterium]